MYSELYSIAIAVMSVHQFDNQLYHELNQSRSGKVVYSNLLRPGESNNNEVTETTADGYYDFSRPTVAENFEQIQPENEQHQAQANEGSSQKQAVPPYTSFEKKLQLHCSYHNSDFSDSSTVNDTVLIGNSDCSDVH